MQSMYHKLSINVFPNVLSVSPTQAYACMRQGDSFVYQYPMCN